MSRNRFVEIRCNLHVCNNETQNAEDKLYKVRSLITTLNYNFPRVWNALQDVVVDEVRHQVSSGFFLVFFSLFTLLFFSRIYPTTRTFFLSSILAKAIVSFKGRVEFKHFIRAKPTPYGYLMRKLNDKLGYLLRFDISTGKQSEEEKNASPFGSGACRADRSVVVGVVVVVVVVVVSSLQCLAFVPLSLFFSLCLIAHNSMYFFPHRLRRSAQIDFTDTSARSCTAAADRRAPSLVG
jgi:hypothetical protein